MRAGYGMAKKAKEKEQASEDFDRIMEELRAAVERMEQGDLGLAASLKLFEHGVGLARRSFDLLNEAEGRVEELLENMEKVALDRAEE